MGLFCKYLQAFDAASSKTARILAFTIIFTSFTGSAALAFTTHHALIDDPVQRMSSAEQSLDAVHVPAPSVADSCFPLLKSIHTHPLNSVTDRNQRSAGKAAAFGLVFGVRFALSPLKKINAGGSSTPSLDLGVWKPGNQKAIGHRSALAVSLYRNCRKEQALQTLQEARSAR